MSVTSVAGPMTDIDLDRLSIDTIRTLSIDPEDPIWPNRSGRVIGMHTFGASAPLKALQEKFGFEPDHVATCAKELLGKQ